MHQREFRAFGSGASSPVARWLRALAGMAHEESGGVGVGAIGMCFTGNFALSMMLEPAMLAPVLAQPSLPLDDPAGLEIAADELRQVAARLERVDLTVLGYRFEGDAFCRASARGLCPGAWFPLRRPRASDASASDDPRPPFFDRHVPRPHSVVTVGLVDRAGNRPLLRATRSWRSSGSALTGTQAAAHCLSRRHRMRLGGTRWTRFHALRNCRVEAKPARSATCSMSSREPVTSWCASATRMRLT